MSNKINRFLAIPIAMLLIVSLYANNGSHSLIPTIDADSFPCRIGTTLNTETDRCEESRPPRCPTGTTFDTATNQCTNNSQPVCRDFARLNTETDRCEESRPPRCPTGTTFDTATNQCTNNSQPQCNDSTWRFNSETDRCERSSSPTCSYGSTYNRDTNRCETKETPNISKDALQPKISNKIMKEFEMNVTKNTYNKIKLPVKSPLK